MPLKLKYPLLSRIYPCLLKRKPSLDSRPLYLCQNGLIYRLGVIVNGQTFNGLGELPNWLTDQAPPSADYTWNKDKWQLDENRQKATLTRQILNKRNEQLSEVDPITAGMRDAFIAQLLSNDEVSYYKELAAYKLKLIQLEQQPNFPYNIEWPPKPQQEQN